ncbi:helix-turn-helix domain-containing protein [Paenibacillus sabinae]|nr:helix-turn-helix domain-containing protein [Paenibacillus sabinae]
MGVPVMEYIRKRRLSLASVELYKGRKIIDIAFDYGYETQSGFTKAFRKEYGYNPTQYAVRMAGCQKLSYRRKKYFKTRRLFYGSYNYLKAVI